MTVILFCSNSTLVGSPGTRVSKKGTIQLLVTVTYAQEPYADGRGFHENNRLGLLC